MRLLVAVADVDSAVLRGGAIDEQARTNTTSVYTAAEVFPMLPERLSTDLTSLNENEDRLAVVVELTARRTARSPAPTSPAPSCATRPILPTTPSPRGSTGRRSPPPAVAASREVEGQVRLQDAVAGAMKDRREERGALALASAESKVVFDGDLLTDLRPDEENRSKEMIQDFMIAANTATAQFLEAHGFPSLRRVLRQPERWDRIQALARELGESLPGAPSAPALQAFLLKRRAATRYGSPTCRSRWSSSSAPASTASRCRASRRGATSASR